MRTITFSVFSDLHDNPGVFYTEAQKRLSVIRASAIQNHSALVFHAGDFCHDYKKSYELLASYHAFPMSVFHNMGNHDCDIHTYEEVIKAYQMPDCYYYLDKEGFRFIFTDTNYFRENGQYFHFSKGNYYGRSKKDMYFIPPEELAWLEDTLRTSPYPCVMISHHSFDREVGSVNNYREVQQIIYDSKKVMLCINGHHHRDHLRVQGGTCWLELNSASYNWLETAHDYFPPEITTANSLANHTVVYNDPLYATITLTDDGMVAIKGVQSSFYLGITREISGNTPLDDCGRPARPTVVTAVITGCNVV